MNPFKLFPKWVWFVGGAFLLLALASNAFLLSDCVKRGRTYLECAALLNAATGNGSAIIDTRTAPERRP